MIYIEQNRLTIIIEGFNGPEMWCNIMSDMLSLLNNEDENFVEKHPDTIHFIKHMLPNYEQVKKMYNTPPEQEMAKF